MRYLSSFILLTILYFHGFAQSSEESQYRFIFLPYGHHFAPLKANIQEPRIGVFKFLDASEMKVDIGNAIDVFGLESRNTKFTMGIDFMAYAFVTGAQGLRLQVDALDGFFGGDISFSRKFEQKELHARLRILHHSAHFVDGHYLLGKKVWMGNREPIPFTRDFGELVMAHNLISNSLNFRYYGGISYSTFIRPAEIQRFAYLGGFEIYSSNIIDAIAEQQTNIFCGYNLALEGIPVYAASNHIQVGIKFGKWNEKGITIYLAYYNGRHMFAEYYDQNLTTVGAGFTVDFF